MPRTLRPTYKSGDILHIYSRGVEQRDIFLDEADRRVFMAYMREALRTHDAGLGAYCLMSNHYHLLVVQGAEPIRIAVHRMLMRYSLYFNLKYRRAGHLFQGRFGSSLCQDEAYLSHLIVYIHRNPVRAGLAASPDSWPWSSHREFLSGAKDFLQLDRLESAAGLPADEMRRRYLDRLKNPRSMPTLETLVRQAACIAGVSVGALVDGSRSAACTRAKRLLLALATNEGYALCAIARLLRCSESALSQLRRPGAPNKSNKECPPA